ncbi:MAG TPA: lysine transporter, partial [Pantoea sp.]|nr:lysine transporter [Pantoea sp.]
PLRRTYRAFLIVTVDCYGVPATYMVLPLFLLIWMGYKLTRGTRFVKYSEMEFPTHKE